MGTTSRVIEYSLALWFAAGNMIELVLQSFLGNPISGTYPLPYWLAPDAIGLYVPIIVANVIVLRYPDVSRKNLWVFCLMVWLMFLFLLPIVFLTTTEGRGRAVGGLVAWSVAAGFAYVFITKNVFGRFKDRFRV